MCVTVSGPWRGSASARRSLRKDVRPRGLFAGRMLRAAKLRRRLCPLAGALPEPVAPVFPPRPGLFLRPRKPRVRIRGDLGVSEEFRPGIPGWVHDTLDMAT